MLKKHQVNRPGPVQESILGPGPGFTTWNSGPKIQKLQKTGSVVISESDDL